MLRLLDLFSGIGGFSLGLERSGGFKTVAFCEIEPFCRRVLAKHWPEVPCYDDVRTLTKQRLSDDHVADIDAICGGFPCQDISSAGCRAGIAGKRSGLWSDFARIIGELRPRFVFVENVADLLVRGLDVVLGDLASLGYDAEWHCIPASSLGFWHRRDRLWLVAYPSSLRRDQGFREETQWGRRLWPWIHHREVTRSCPADDHEIRSRFIRVVDGLPNHVDRLGALGNAVVPQIPELIGRAILASRAAA